MFILQKHSNYGSSTPAIARTVLQGCDILQFIDHPELEKETAKNILSELQRHLIKCVEIQDNLTKEISIGYEEFADCRLNAQSGAHAISLPGVGDIQSKAESFLQSAKLAIAMTGNLFQPFYKIEHGHKYHELCSWAEKEFGPSDQLAIMLKSSEPFVKRIVNMRNCVDHPKKESSAYLVTANFKLAQVGAKFELIEPTWGLANESLQPMRQDFETIIEEIIRLGENVLMGIFYKHRCNSLIEIEVIPLDQRDPDIPKRLRIKLA